MRSRKYLKDYQLTPEVTAKGRLSPVASYVGAWHRFKAEPLELDRAKKLYIALTAAAVVLLLVQLWYTDLLDRERRYLLLPMAFNIFPAFGTVMGVARLRSAPERMTLKQRDRICNRLPAFSFGFFAFAALSLIACAVQLILNGVTLPTALYCADALVLSVLTFLIFRLRRVLKTEIISG